MARLNAEFKEDIYKELVSHAASEGRSVSDVIRTLVLEWNARKREESAQRARFLERGEVSNGD